MIVNQMLPMSWRWNLWSGGWARTVPWRSGHAAFSRWITSFEKWPRPERCAHGEHRGLMAMEALQQPLSAQGLHLLIETKYPPGKYRAGGLRQVRVW